MTGSTCGTAPQRIKVYDGLNLAGRHDHDPEQFVPELPLTSTGLNVSTRVYLSAPRPRRSVFLGAYARFVTGDTARGRVGARPSWAKVGLRPWATGAIGAVVARFVHTEEVTGSNPVSPTPTASTRGSIRESSRPSRPRQARHHEGVRVVDQLREVVVGDRAVERKLFQP